LVDVLVFAFSAFNLLLFLFIISASNLTKIQQRNLKIQGKKPRTFIKLSEYASYRFQGYLPRKDGQRADGYRRQLTGKAEPNGERREDIRNWETGKYETVCGRMEQ
jgi:hypothetical protein